MEKVKVEQDKVKERTLSDVQVRDIARLMIQLEDSMRKPQDFEWAIEKGTTVYMCGLLLFLLFSDLFCYYLVTFLLTFILHVHV